MNREKIITEIQNKLTKAYMLKDRGKLDRIISEVFDDVYSLRPPITLVEFLGWEENTEYKFSSYVFKIKDDTLYEFNYVKNIFEPSHLRLCSGNIDMLRIAKKREKREKIEKKYFLVLKKEIRKSLNLLDYCIYYADLDGYLLSSRASAKKVSKKEFEEIKKTADIFELEEV